MNRSKQELDRMAEDPYSETLRYIANLQSIFDISEEKYISVKIMTCWMEAIGNIAPRVLYMSQMINSTAFMRRWSRSWTDIWGKLTVDQVGTYSVSSQHEQHHEDNQRRMMKINTELLPTETTHLMKTNEQSLIQAKPILKTSSRRGDPVDDWYWQDVRQRFVSHNWALCEIFGYGWWWNERGYCEWNER